jgi:putative transposase
MLGLKSMRCAKILLAGIAAMHMISKSQPDSTKGQVASAANQFYSLVF